MHWIFDDFVTRDEVRAVNEQWPGPSDPRWWSWRRPTAVKSAMESNWPPAALELLRRVHTPEVCSEVARLIGVDALAPDPRWPRELFGGGLHCIREGGFLGMHVDFNQHPDGCWRRANLLLYLNEHWEHDWGGYLHLGDDLQIAPIAGRAVLFPTTEDSWHGHPDPVSGPPGLERRSIAVYYYSPERPAGATEPHSTIYRP